MISGIDISHHQNDKGSLNWANIKSTGIQFCIVKAGGGDGSSVKIYIDPKCSENYQNSVAAGLITGLYWFAGGGDVNAEADRFIKACKPFAAGDIFVLDWEVKGFTGNPDQWCAAFITRVKDATGTTPLIYMNTSTENSIDWAATRATGAGLWVADYRYTADKNVPIKHWPFYAIHQYTSTQPIDGIVGNVDHDVFFGTAAQLKKYGYTAPSAPAPVPSPAPSPAPVTPPTPVSTTIADPAVETPIQTPASPAPAKSKYTKYPETKHFKTNGLAPIWDLDANTLEDLRKVTAIQSDAYDAVGYATHPTGGIYAMNASNFGDADKTQTPNKNIGININDLTETNTPPSRDDEQDAEIGAINAVLGGLLKLLGSIGSLILNYLKTTKK